MTLPLSIQFSIACSDSRKWRKTLKKYLRDILREQPARENLYLQNLSHDAIFAEGFVRSGT